MWDTFRQWSTLWNWQTPRGKISPFLNIWGVSQLLKPLRWSVDYTTNDYNLFKSIYFGSKFNGRGEEYLLASPFGKNIVNALASFTMGTVPAVTLVEENNDPAQDDVNDWLKANATVIFDFVRWGFRDGDSYFYIDELGNASLLDPMSVDVMLDPLDGHVIGYNVTEYVAIQDPVTFEPTDWTYQKQYRTDSMQVVRWPGKMPIVQGQIPEDYEVVYKAVYHEEGNEITVNGEVQQEGNPESALLERPLPIVHFANDLEARGAYGNSEFQNLLVLFMRYHQVLEQAITNNVYNNNPILMVKGVVDSAAMKQQALDAFERDPQWDQQEDAGVNPNNPPMKFGPGSVIYATGEGDAKYVTTQGNMADTQSLLGTLFNLIVQGSETPEFIFGAAVASSQASTTNQMPQFVKKAERKRNQLRNALIDIVQLYAFRQQELSNPDFLKLSDEVDVSLKWPEILSDDKLVDVQIVKQLQATGAITDETAVELLLGDRVDSEQEVEDAQEQQQARAAQQKVVPTQSDRLLKELMSSGKYPTDTPLEEDPTYAGMPAADVTGQEDNQETYQMVYDEDGVPVAEMVTRTDDDGRTVQEVNRFFENEKSGTRKSGKSKK